MRRRTFLSTLPAGALLAGAGVAHARTQTAPTDAAPARPQLATPYAGVGMGDRITGAPFAGRSTVWSRKVTGSSNRALCT